MRAVLLGPYPLDRQLFMGGVDAIITNLAEGLNALGKLDLHVVAAYPTVKKERVIRTDGITIHYLPRSSRLSSVTLNWRDEQTVKAKLDSLRPDVVDVQGTDFYAGAAVSSKYPSIVTIHGIMRKDEKIRSALRSRLRSYLIGYYERRCVDRARDIIASSRYVDREFTWPKGARIYHIENPIPVKYFAIEDSERHNTVLFMGRLIRRKGVMELVEAVSDVRKAVPNVRVRIAGEDQAEPDYAKQVRETIVRNGLQENVELIGFLDENATMAEYSQCSLVVLPSRQETAPMAVQQAMAAGKAVVATRVGGLEYLVSHEETGLLVDFGDRPALAKAMIDLLADHDCRKAMGRRAKEIAVRFRSDTIAEETYRVFQLVAGRTPQLVGGDE